jgi:nucleotide-binding universal stress UspA family protein
MLQHLPLGETPSEHATATAVRIAAALDRVAPSSPEATVLIGGDRRALLREMDAPIVVVGPHCDVRGRDAFDGTYVVALDGSIGDEGVIPVVAAWTVEFGGTPWLVDVVARWSRHPDVIESAYVNHRAGRLRRRTGCDVEHETLHGEHPARAIVEFADGAAASLIFVGTDADTSRARRRRRSLATEIVRHAACPVVLLRLPEVRQPPRPVLRPTPAPVPPVWSRAWCEQYGPDAVRLRRARTGTPPRSRR